MPCVLCVYVMQATYLRHFTYKATVVVLSNRMPSYIAYSERFYLYTLLV